MVICGRPQVGKSSVAALLAEYLVACGIQQDNVAVIDHIGSFAQDRNVGFKRKYPTLFGLLRAYQNNSPV